MVSIFTIISPGWTYHCNTSGSDVHAASLQGLRVSWQVVKRFCKQFNAPEKLLVAQHTKYVEILEQA